MINRTVRRGTALAGVVALGAGLVACSPGVDTEAATYGLDDIPVEVQAAADAFEGTYTYWLGLTFPEESNVLEEARIQAWGDALGLDVEVLQVNQSETVTQVNGAIEAGTLPTALTVSYDLLQTLGVDGKLQDVTAAYTGVGEAHGGWLEQINAATNSPSFDGAVYGVPLGFYGNVLFRRTDALTEAGFSGAPQTWEELAEQARTAPRDGEYGMGFALSNVLDGNLTTAMMQSWGGRVANDEGTECTISSDETADFLEWIRDAWEDGLFPPTAVTWDGAGDNNSYLSGESLFIANTGSVYLSMAADDPELAEVSDFSALPAGPELQVSPVDPRYRVVPTTTSEEGLILSEHLFGVLADDDYMSEFMANTTYGPVLTSQLEYDIYQDSPVHAGLLELAEKGTAPASPDTAGTAYSDYQNAYSTVRMVQRVLIDGIPIDQAMTEAQTACQAIYDARNG